MGRRVNHFSRGRTALAAAFLLAGTATHAFAQDAAQPDEPAGERPLSLSAAQMFAIADTARDSGDYATAERAYRALTQDPDLEMRTEARWRLAHLYADRMERPRDAAVLLRRILDDKPDEISVRLELARVQALMGNLGAARRELRAVQAGELPPAVAQLVRFYSGALSATKMSGGSFEAAIAPNTNINRATSDTTLDTVIGDFALSEDAQAKSGLGLSLRGQAYQRLPVSRATQILARVSADADIYGRHAFDDVALAAQVGPQIDMGADQLSLAAAVTRRWFGWDPSTLDYGVTATWRHRLNDRAQLRLDASALREGNDRNSLQSGGRYSLSATFDRALSRTTGIGMTLSGNRLGARDPGYATTSGGASAYAFKEFGRTTAVLNLGYSHLEADKRLFIYPERRRDDRFFASLSATLRALSVGTFAPLLRVRYERNLSTINIYDFSRLAAEFGVTTAF